MSQLCDPSRQGESVVGRCVGEIEGAIVGARVGSMLGICVGTAVGTAVGIIVCTHLVASARSTTKPSKHWHTYVTPKISHCVVLMSQPCAPSTQRCKVGRCVGNELGAEEGAVEGGTVGTVVGTLVGAAVGSAVLTQLVSLVPSYTKPSKQRHSKLDPSPDTSH